MCGLPFVLWHCDYFLHILEEAINGREQSGL
jgi:hypothetical protein